MRLSDVTDVDKMAAALNARMFKRRYSGNDKVFTDGFKHPNWEGDTVLYIRELLLKGYDVRTGYTASAVRGARNYHVFYR